MFVHAAFLSRCGEQGSFFTRESGTRENRFANHCITLRQAIEGVGNDAPTLAGRKQGSSGRT